jgi:hypothetical protein
MAHRVHEIIASPSASSPIRRCPLPRAAASLTIRSDRALFDDGLAALRWPSTVVRRCAGPKGESSKLPSESEHHDSTLQRSVAPPHPPFPLRPRCASRVRRSPPRGFRPPVPQVGNTTGHLVGRQRHCWQSHTKRSEVDGDNTGFLRISSVNPSLLAQECENGAHVMSHTGSDILRKPIR